MPDFLSWSPYSLSADKGHVCLPGNLVNFHAHMDACEHRFVMCKYLPSSITDLGDILQAV